MSDNPFTPGKAADTALAEPQGDAPGGERGDPAEVTGGRRAWAVILSLLGVPGLGLTLLGRGTRTAAWCGGALASFAVAILANRYALGWLLYTAFLAVIAVVLGGAIDCLVVRAGRLPRRSRAIMTIVAALLVGQGLASLVRELGLEAFQSPSASMAPALWPGDHFFVDKTITVPRRGDVFAFKVPHQPEVMYVKRVIAFAGDTVEIRQSVVFVNGQPLPQEDARPDCSSLDGVVGGPDCVIKNERVEERSYLVVHTYPPFRGPEDAGPWTVPYGHVFVLGDNRDNSNDSRRGLGMVPIENMVGRASLIWWSRDPEGGGFRWSRFGQPIQ